MECQEPRVCQEEIVLHPDNNVQLEEKKFKSLWQYCLKLKICCIQLIKIIIHFVILCLLFHNTKVGPNLIAFLLEAPSDVFCVMCRFGKRMHQRYIHEIMIILSSFQRCPVRQKIQCLCDYFGAILVACVAIFQQKAITALRSGRSWAYFRLFSNIDRSDVAHLL